MYLETIDTPKDVKKLTIHQCSVLAEEIRQALIQTVSSTGGHLSSNLGAVELTVALHYVLDSPADKIIFDTSHQCYTHKILTGRKEAFLDPARYKTYSGYTNPQESIHDLFKFGHTSTSVSLACGMAKMRDLNGTKEHVAAVIGDAALGGGEALEGLNYAGAEIKGNLIIVLNDNQMSIAENHGALYHHLNVLREHEGRCVWNLFTALGYAYIYVPDGNDMAQLVPAFEQAKEMERPVVVHLCTVKGKGYPSAEACQEESHFVKPFSPEQGIRPVQIAGERYDKIVRDYLLEKMRKDPLVVAMVAAVPNVLAFDAQTRQAMGSRYIDTGIMEEHAISMAAGIARNGGKPVFATRSTFIQRTYDQISQELCINRMPVTIILVNASVYAPTDMTHMGLFDIPMLSNIPELVFLAPANKQEYLAMLEWSMEQNEHPVVIRAPRNGVYEAGYVPDADYGRLNRYLVTRSGRETAIIAAGDFFQLGEETADLLEQVAHHKVTLVNPRYLSGTDKELLDSLKENHHTVVTLEDGVLDGGFGQKIAAYYGCTDMKVLNYGFRKEFTDYYDTSAMLTRNRLRAEMIVEDICKGAAVCTETKKETGI